jgi:hypothetical protein
MLGRVLLLSAIFGAVSYATDPLCPAYPAPVRAADAQRIEAEQAASQWLQMAIRTKRLRPMVNDAKRVNFVDDAIFSAMDQAGVAAAPATTDAEFLRRVYIDLIGRIPTTDQATSFLNDANPDKRNALIETLLASPAYIDNWTYQFADHFQVTSGYYNVISIGARNQFYFFLRDFIARDRPYKEVATDILTAAGDGTVNGPVNVIIKGWQNGDPNQDTYDTLANFSTVKFLGIQTQCVSCHNGRGHLEPINAWLTQRRRTDFWGLSAFFSRIAFNFYTIDAYRQSTKGIVVDRASGAYTTAVDPNNPGPRPPRTGGPYTPAFMLTGETPNNGNWRQEFARILTSNRQFAKATVNVIWSHFFSSGIVDPVDGWDLARQDPNNLPGSWTLQPTHPQLLEDLADYFINNNYSVKKLVRLLAQSSAYQLSSRYGDGWQPAYARLWAKHQPARMTAEEVYDSIITATRTEVPMYLQGLANPIYYANQLPDPTEPRDLYNSTNQFVQSNSAVRSILLNFGRPDWNTVTRSSKSTLLQVLFIMNDSSVNFRTFATQQAAGATNVARLLQAGISDPDAVKQLFLGTLTRYPTDNELSIAVNYKSTNRENWLSDLQWALLNKVDFLFNY